MTEEAEFEDGFEEIEFKIARFASNHKVAILIVSGVLLSVLLFAMIVGVICIPITFSLAEQNQTERYNAHYPPTSEHYVSDETIKNWNDIIVPVVMFVDGYLANAILVITISYMIIVGYFLVRWIYRSRRNRAEGEG
jgi:H+/gluconate symporter-like permease